MSEIEINYNPFNAIPTPKGKKKKKLKISTIKNPLLEKKVKAKEKKSN